MATITHFETLSPGMKARLDPSSRISVEANIDDANYTSKGPKPVESDFNLSTTTRKELPEQLILRQQRIIKLLKQGDFE